MYTHIHDQVSFKEYPNHLPLTVQYMKRTMANLVGINQFFTREMKTCYRFSYTRT